MKTDHRPQRGGWADGGYMCKCVRCGEDYSGDKRSTVCADCAYSEPEQPIAPHDPPVPTPRTDEKAEWSGGELDYCERVPADFARTLEREVNGFVHMILEPASSLTPGRDVVAAMVRLKEMKDQLAAVRAEIDARDRRIKELEAAINSASVAFCGEGEDGAVAARMMEILHAAKKNATRGNAKEPEETNLKHTETQ